MEGSLIADSQSLDFSVNFWFPSSHFFGFVQENLFICAFFCIYLFFDVNPIFMSSSSFQISCSSSFSIRSVFELFNENSNMRLYWKKWYSFVFCSALNSYKVYQA